MGKHPVDCKWIFTIKYNSDDTIERFKARLVAKGYTQLEGLNYLDTFFQWSGSRIVLFLGDSLVSWRSKKKPTVSRNSSEDEYRSMADTTCEFVWLSSLLLDLHCPLTGRATLFRDNQSALHIASNHVFHERTKHIENDCHVVLEKLQNELSMFDQTINLQISSRKLFSLVSSRVTCPIWDFIVYSFQSWGEKLELTMYW